jgi:hypothetical protein
MEETPTNVLNKVPRIRMKNITQTEAMINLFKSERPSASFCLVCRFFMIKKENVLMKK